MMEHKPLIVLIFFGSLIFPMKFFLAVNKFLPQSHRDTEILVALLCALCDSVAKTGTIRDRFLQSEPINPISGSFSEFPNTSSWQYLVTQNMFFDGNMS